MRTPPDGAINARRSRRDLTFERWIVVYSAESGAATKAKTISNNAAASGTITAVGTGRTNEFVCYAARRTAHGGDYYYPPYGIFYVSGIRFEFRVSVPFWRVGRASFARAAVRFARYPSSRFTFPTEFRRYRPFVVTRLPMLRANSRAL